eukprot:tig00000042_g15615.t1
MAPVACPYALDPAYVPPAPRAAPGPGGRLPCRRWFGLPADHPLRCTRGPRCRFSHDDRSCPTPEDRARVREEARRMGLLNNLHQPIATRPAAAPVAAAAAAAPPRRSGSGGRGGRASLPLRGLGQ